MNREDEVDAAIQATVADITTNDPAVDMWSDAFHQVTGRHLSEPEPDRRSTAAIDAEDRLEAIAEDRAWEGRWGGTDSDADWAANRYEEQFERGWN